MWLAPAAALAVSLAGNVLVIPAHGARGVAWVSVASQALLLTIAGLAARRLSREPVTPAGAGEAPAAPGRPA